MSSLPKAPTSAPMTARRGIPRPVEAAVALAGLLLSAPVVLIASVLIEVTSGWPVLFRQERVGRGGRRFRICKLRTMRPSSGKLDLTGSNDPRVTPFGRFLRKTKIDELPQLWNVLKGDMSLVGPRPEVPQYVDPRNPLWAEVLQVRPGITDPVTVRLRDEEILLAGAADRQRFYLEQLQPFKLEGYVAYIRARSWWTDLGVLGKTVAAVFRPASPPEGPSAAGAAVSNLQGSATSDRLRRDR